MSDGDIYEAVLGQMLSAYFTAVPMQALSREYDKVYSTLATTEAQTLTPIDRVKRKVIKMLLAFTWVTLTEYDKLRAWTESHPRAAQTICDIDGFTEFCTKLGRPENFMAWTHLVLTTNGYLRLGETPKLTNNGLQKEALKPDQLKAVRGVFNSVRLLFYGLLFTRLTNSLKQAQDPLQRYNVEATLFISLLAFYSDYVLVGKSREANEYWKTLYKQVTTYYLDERSPFFTSLRLNHPDRPQSSDLLIPDAQHNALVIPLKAFLSQDNISSVQQCLTTQFIHKYARLAINDYGKYEVQSVLQCLHNMHAIVPRMNRWLRNKIVGTVTDAFGSGWRGIVSFVGGVATLTGVAAGAGKWIYNKLYSDKYPIPTAVGGVAIALVAFGATAVLAAGAGLVKVTAETTGDKIKAATAFVFRSKDVEAPGLSTRPKDETATTAPYLEYVRSKDGVFEAIYNVTTLPALKVNLEPASNSGWGNVVNNFFQQQRGGAVSNAGVTDVHHMKKLMAKGFVRDELPVEMQRWIKKNLQLSTGATQRGGAAVALVKDDSYPDTVFTREVINIDKGGVAADKAYVQREGEYIQLIMPLPPLQQQALEEAEFVVDEMDPSTDVMQKTSDTALPSVIQTRELGVMSEEDVSDKSRSVPIPPIMPDLGPSRRSYSYPSARSNYRTRSVSRKRQSKSRSRSRSLGRRRAQSTSRKHRRRSVSKARMRKRSSRSRSRTSSRIRRRQR